MNAALYGSTPPFRFKPAPRFWRGNMCGTHVPGLGPVAGGAADASLVLSWFFDRYDQRERAQIMERWKACGISHVAVSWPDSQDFGHTPAQFRAMCLELIDNGCYPCVFLSAKPTSSATIRDLNETLANMMLVLPELVGVVPMFCIGWELSLWLSPADVQLLIDEVSRFVQKQEGTLLYVHFQSGYFAYQINGLHTNAFWWANQGKLTGVLHQRDLAWDKAMYQARITDCLQRFSGGFNFPPDSGVAGVPFDFVAFEITAALAFDDGMSEADQNAWGNDAITTPPVGTVIVQGSGNGFLL